MIKRTDGRWQDQIKLPGMTKPKYFYGKTQREVTRKMAEWKKENTKAATFLQASKEWEAEHEKQSAYNTMKAYQAPLKRLREQFGRKQVQDITADEVSAYLRHMAGQGYAQSTLSMEFACVNMICDYAIVRGYASVNPCGPVKLPKAPKTRRSALTKEQMEAVQNGVNEEFGLFAYMLLYTGMRRGELLALRWEDIDFEAGLINVTKSVYFVDSVPVVKEPKTEAGRRTVVLLDDLRKVLTEPGTGYIFGGEKPLTDYQFRCRWAKWGKAVGLGKNYMSAAITPHQLRHEYATILHCAGVDEADAMNLMGHSSIRVTKEVYTHIRKERMGKTKAQIDEYLHR